MAAQQGPTIAQTLRSFLNLKVGNVFIASILILLAAVLLQRSGYYSKYNEIDGRLEAGTKPLALEPTVAIDRPHETEVIRDFIEDTTSKAFGVVLGPSGTGKTYVVRLACNKKPSGVLYYEIVDPNFLAEDLAKAIGMKLEDDKSFVDILLEKVGIDFFPNFFRLPKNLSLAMSYVLKVLGERAIKYRERHHKVPCIFIDGIDLLAKEHPEIFIHLVDRAKFYANSGTLRIVLVSSEGHVTPLLHNTSSKSRLAQVIEVMDVPLDETVDYLSSQGAPVTLARRIFQICGGRFVYLDRAIEIYKTHLKFNHSEDDIVDIIKTSLFNRFVHRQADRLYEYDKHNMAATIMKHVFLSGSANPSDLLGSAANEEERDAVMSAINGLIKLNLMRYTAKGNLTWHSQLVSNSMTDQQ